MSNYYEKLKDPRWQKLRLKVFERDEFQCRACKSTKDTLSVHHKYYIPGKDPWEYELDALITLCESCHGIEYEFRPQSEQLLLQRLREFGYSVDGINRLIQEIWERGHQEWLFQYIELK